METIFKKLGSFVSEVLKKNYTQQIVKAATSLNAEHPEGYRVTYDGIYYIY